jgi:hypothetical protein
MGEARKHKVSVLLTDDEFRRLDEYCLDRGFKKSTLLTRLLLNHLDEERFHVQSGLFESVAPTRPLHSK